MNEKLIEELNEPWEEKLKKTAIIQQQRWVKLEFYLQVVLWGVTVRWVY